MQAFKVAIAARRERHRRLMLGLGPAAERDKRKEAGGEGSQEDRMNELAAEKRIRRLKEARINRRTFMCFTIFVVTGDQHY